MPYGLHAHRYSLHDNVKAAYPSKHSALQMLHQPVQLSGTVQGSYVRRLCGSRSEQQISDPADFRCNQERK